MASEPVWRVGPTMRKIYDSLHLSLRLLMNTPDVYLDDAFLQKANVRRFDWNLDDTDDFFECMTQEAFLHTQPSDPTEPVTTYEEVKPPDSDNPVNVFDLEYCARGIEAWFHKLQCRKVAEDGHGCVWPEEGGFWIPQQLRKYEDLYQGCRMAPAISWMLCRAKCNTSDQPHQIYHAWHGDEGKEGVVSRSELEIFIRTLKGRMTIAQFSTHIVPILLLSIHGSKARIMIAHYNHIAMKLDIKCGKLEQFDGFEERAGRGHKGIRERPRDYNVKRDLFFRWLNPVCKGKTYLEDSKGAPEMVMRGHRGRRRLVPRYFLPESASTDSSQGSG